MKCMRFVQMLAVAAVISVLSLNASGSTYQVIYSFTGGQDGSGPVDVGNLAIDSQGNLYGTTIFGGSCGEGVLFELSPNGAGGWTETVLHNFCYPQNLYGKTPDSYGIDGAAPYAAPAFTATPYFNNQQIELPTWGGGQTGCGSVFNYFTSIDFGSDSFRDCGPQSGARPYASAIVDPASGNYWFPASGGGWNGQGTLDSGSPGASPIDEYSFCSLSGCADGAYPTGGMLYDGQTYYYGMTTLGGASGQGVVYQFSDVNLQKPTLKVLHSFAGGSNDGSIPYFAGLTFGTTTCTPSGCVQDLWGTTLFGGSGSVFGTGYGTVFDMSLDGSSFAVVHSFDLFDGAFPFAGLTNLNGTFYGTTSASGFVGVTCCPFRLQLGRGTIYSLTPSGTLTTLHVFTGSDGALPYSGLVADTSGNLYGVTFQGGAHGYGVVYEITP